MTRLFQGVRGEATLLDHEVQATMRWVPLDEEARVEVARILKNRRRKGRKRLLPKGAEIQYARHAGAR